MSSPPDKQPNGARLAALLTGLRRTTPITTQGQGGSFRRTPGGYTTPHISATTSHLPPWHFYERAGYLHLTPGLVNGQVPTVADGTPLDSYPPPPLISLEELGEKERWIILEANFRLKVETLFWPDYDEVTNELVGYTPFQGVVDGSILQQLVVRVLDKQPALITWDIDGPSYIKRLNTETEAVFHLNGDLPAHGKAAADFTSQPLLSWPAIDTHPFPLSTTVDGTPGTDPDLGSFTNVTLQTDGFAQFSRFHAFAPYPP